MHSIQMGHALLQGMRILGTPSWVRSPRGEQVNVRHYPQTSSEIYTFEPNKDEDVCEGKCDALMVPRMVIHKI